jgi:hypothetical protein
MKCVVLPINANHIHILELHAPLSLYDTLRRDSLLSDCLRLRLLLRLWLRPRLAGAGSAARNRLSACELVGCEPVWQLSEPRLPKVLRLRTTVATPGFFGAAQFLQTFLASRDFFQRLSFPKLHPAPTSAGAHNQMVYAHWHDNGVFITPAA